jgi:hypothetical protein
LPIKIKQKLPSRARYFEIEEILLTALIAQKA